MIKKVGRCIFLCFAFIPFLCWKINAKLIGNTKAFQGMSQFCSLFPGKFGELFRAAFYRLSFKNSSQKTSVAFLSTFSDPRAQLENNVSIGAYCNIGWAHIKKDCIISSHVCITSGKNDHSFDDIDIPIRLQKSSSTKVTIGENCWIGVNVTIMADIGEGSVIAANSVVTEAIPPYSVVAGVPAKIIRSRLTAEEQKERTQENALTEKPTVLQLLTTFNMGGAERLALFILEKEKENYSGVMGAIYGESGDLDKVANSYNIPTFNAHIDSCGRIQAIWRLYKMLRQYKVDVVQIHAAYLLNYIVPAAKLAGIPVVYTEHSIFDLEQQPKLRRTIRLTAPFLSAITCISQPLADYFIHTIGIDAKRIEIIENGIDIELFSPKDDTNTVAELPWKNANASEPLFVFGTVARLCMEKDHPNMLRAFAMLVEKYPQARLIIVGDGVERTNLEALIKELNITDFVHLAGKALDITERLRSFDVFVMSSQHEGLPMVILEAMACKLPVISTSAGDIASLNASGENLHLVPIKDSPALAEAMEKMLTDVEFRENYAKNGFTFVNNHKSINKVTEAYYSVFKNIGLPS